ncbi:manganese-dependent inorganic pyrophosphatase [bacterium]|nr:manganese-dependent inorganic pyrophosphatase [bacterium]
MTIYVMGHKNPDTDTIVASITATELLRARGLDAVACRQGELNPESKFVLDTFKLEMPEMIESVKEKDIALVDTTNPAQLPDDLSEANIIFIADHHNLGGIKTATPPEMYVQPVGSSCSVLFNIFEFEGKSIPANIAGAMMLAILSDTVLFKSPTTTEWDKVAVEKLSRIAGVEKPLELGLQMLKIKSSIENDTPIDLINRDFKEFNIKDKKIGIGQIELIDSSMAENKKPALLSEMKRIQKENGYNSVLLLITDIMKEGSDMLVVSDDIESIEKVFGIQCNETNCAWIDGMISRKKQVIPPLQTKL